MCTSETEGETERDEDKGGEALPVTSLNQQLLSSGKDTPALLKRHRHAVSRHHLFSSSFHRLTTLSISLCDFFRLAPRHHSL